MSDFKTENIFAKSGVVLINKKEVPVLSL